MSAKVNWKGGVKRDPIPEDVHMARCIGFIDIGTQFSERYQNDSRKGYIIWEIPGLHMKLSKKDGTEREVVRTISKKYTLSLGKKANLRKDLEAWRGREFTNEELESFHPKQILGKTCQLQVIHKKEGSEVYSNISSIMKVPAGVEVQPQSNETMFYFMDDDRNIPANIPQWFVALINESKEFKEAGVVDHEDGPITEHGDAADDDLPF